MRVSKDDKLYEKSKNNYKIEIGTHKLNGMPIKSKELYRLNHKKGFYNFVSYLDLDATEEDIKRVILADIKSLSRRKS